MIEHPYVWDGATTHQLGFCFYKTPPSAPMPADLRISWSLMAHPWESWTMLVVDIMLDVLNYWNVSLVDPGCPWCWRCWVLHWVSPLFRRWATTPFWWCWLSKCVEGTPYGLLTYMDLTRFHEVGFFPWYLGTHVQKGGCHALSVIDVDLFGISSQMFNVRKQ